MTTHDQLVEVALAILATMVFFAMVCTSGGI